MATEPSLAQLLEADLAKSGMQQVELLQRLNLGEEKPLTESAISMWKRPGRSVPRKYIKRLIEIFGPDSHIASAERSGIIKIGSAGPLDHFVDSFRLGRNTADSLSDELINIVRPDDPEAFEREIFNALPNEFHQFLERPMRVGSALFRFDYQSPRAVVEVVRTRNALTPNNADKVKRAMLHLALAQRIDGENLRQYLLVIGVASGNENAPYLERIRLEASLMGIQILVTNSTREATDYVIGLEQGFYKNYFATE